MTTKNIEAKAREIKELTRMKEEIEAEIAALQKEIKEEMEARDTEELIAGEYKIRYQTISSKRFDAKAFQKKYEDLYGMYVKESTSRRFSIA